jgi:hypothetical protein
MVPGNLGESRLVPYNGGSLARLARTHEVESLKIVFASLLCVTGASAFATVWTESEPNNTYITPNMITNFQVGDTLTGVTTGVSQTVAGIGSADYFDISFASGPVGLYKHRLVINSTTTGNFGSIRGKGVSGHNQLLGEVSAQMSTNSQRYNQWYGFGKGERMIYRVQGTASSTANYTISMTTEAVSVTNLGNFQPGSIFFTTRGFTDTIDTDFWIYDSNFNAIPGYGADDISTSVFQGTLNRNFAPGTYYIAISDFNLVNNQFLPNTDGNEFGWVVEQPGYVFNHTSASGDPLDMRIVHGGGSLNWINTKQNPYDVNWAKFTVVPEPGTIATLGIGAVALLRRRRRG